MSFFKRFLPHLAVAMALACLVILYLEKRNPMMGFLNSNASVVFLALLCLVCAAMGVCVLLDHRER